MSAQNAGNAHLGTIMKDISEALSLDRTDRVEDAYRKYLECVLRITSKLLVTVHKDGGHLVVSKEVSKFVKLGQQCMDRVANIVGDRTVKSTPDTGMRLPLKSGPGPPPPPTTPSPVGSGVTSPGVITSPSRAACPDENQNHLQRGSASTDDSLSWSQRKSKKLTPMELASRQNQLLLKAFKARQAQAHARGNRSAEANLSLTLQRKMAENLAIGKAQEEALAKKMKERQQRLEEQAARRFHAPIGLSAEEQEQRHLYRKVLEFEQEMIDMYDWRKRLEESPNNIDTISQLIQNVLRCEDHPLTQQLKVYQSVILNKLQPLVENKMVQINLIRVPLPEAVLTSIQKYKDAFHHSSAIGQSGALSQASPSASQSHSSLPDGDRSEGEKKEERMSQAETESKSRPEICESDAQNDTQNDTDSRDNPVEEDLTCKDHSDTEPDRGSEDNVSRESSTVDIDDRAGSGVSEDSMQIDHTDESVTDVSGNKTVADVASDVKHNLEVAMSRGQALQESLKAQGKGLKMLTRQATEEYERYNVENMDDLFDSEEDDDSDEEGISSVDVKQPKAEEQSQDESVSKQEPSETETAEKSCILPRNPSYENLDNKIKELKNEAYHRHLQGITEDIVNSLEKIQVLFVVVYEELDSAEGRDQCNLLIEDCFFQPLWQYLLALFRLSNEPKEIALASMMTRHQGALPADFNVREKLCLTPLSEGEDDFPYKPAVSEFSRLPEYPTMLSKLDCLVKTSRCVLKCVEQYYRAPGKPAQHTPSIGADDLLPVLCYVVARSQLPQVISECHAMDRFIHEGYMFGEEGYCLTSFQTAINYLVSLGMKAA